MDEYDFGIVGWTVDDPAISLEHLGHQDKVVNLLILHQLVDSASDCFLNSNCLMKKMTKLEI